MYPLMDWKSQALNREQIIYDFAIEVYMYGFPLVLMDLTRRGLLSLEQKNIFQKEKERMLVYQHSFLFL